MDGWHAALDLSHCDPVTSAVTARACPPGTNARDNPVEHTSPNRNKVAGVLLLDSTEIRSLKSWSNPKESNLQSFLHRATYYSGQGRGEVELRKGGLRSRPKIKILCSIVLLDFIIRPGVIKTTTFRKLVLLPSSEGLRLDRSGGPNRLLSSFHLKMESKPTSETLWFY
jgi:hypothetical protein